MSLLEKPPWLSRSHSEISRLTRLYSGDCLLLSRSLHELSSMWIRLISTAGTGNVHNWWLERSTEDIHVLGAVCVTKRLSDRKSYDIVLHRDGWIFVCLTKRKRKKRLLIQVSDHISMGVNFGKGYYIINECFKQDRYYITDREEAKSLMKISLV